MADPTQPGTVGKGMTVLLEDSKITQVDVVTTYTTQNFMRISDKAGNFVHLILSDATPSGDANYNAHPIGSICIDYVAGAIYRKTDAGDNWTAM